MLTETITPTNRFASATQTIWLAQRNIDAYHLARPSAGHPANREPSPAPALPDPCSGHPASTMAAVEASDAHVTVPEDEELTLSQGTALYAEDAFVGGSGSGKAKGGKAKDGQAKDGQAKDGQAKAGHGKSPGALSKAMAKVLAKKKAKAASKRKGKSKDDKDKDGKDQSPASPSQADQGEAEEQAAKKRPASALMKKPASAQGVSLMKKPAAASASDQGHDDKEGSLMPVESVSERIQTNLRDIVKARKFRDLYKAGQLPQDIKDMYEAVALHNQEAFIPTHIR